MSTEYLDKNGLTYLWTKLKAKFQEKLVSGINIKTINNQSVLGSGNISISGGSGGSVLDYYPVGSYYETSDTSFDPNVSWGGAWDLEEDGMMLLSSSETHTVGDTGGEETVSLAIANMPAHSHKSGANGEYIVTTADAEANNTRVAYSSSGNRYVDGLTSQSHFHHRANTNSVGSGTAHNNMPPYKVVNRWHRTA